MISSDYLIKMITKIFFEFYAKITNKRFFCRALKGDSLYNTAINSDLTVSCNCCDNYGAGKIGDLRKQSLKEIFSGKKGDQFRRSLAKGKPPIVNCVVCSDLCLINKNKAERYINDFDLPKGLLIENTIDCNLNCLSCNRKRICSLRDKKSMTYEDLEKVSKQIKENDIKRIAYHNLGEPFFSKNIKKEMEIIRKHNPDVIMNVSTNGVLVDSETKQEAALLFDSVVFSIHGSTQESVNKYQKGTDFNKAYSNMSSLVRFRNFTNKKKPKIIWKYVLFRWNDSKKLIIRAIELAKEAKVDQIYFEKTLSPLRGISYKYYFGQGYLNKIAKFNGKICKIKLGNT